MADIADLDMEHPFLSKAMSNSSSSSISNSSLSIQIGQSIGVLVSVPSVILYCFECWMIIRYWKHHFSTSFYKLFLLSAFNNILMNFVPSLLFDRLIRLGWINSFFLSSPWWVPRLLCFIMFYNYHCENIATLFTLIHRMSVIVCPLDYEKFWRYLLPISALCIYLGPFLFTYRLLIWPLVFTLNPDNSVEIIMNSTVLGYKPPVTNFMMMLITSVSYLIIHILLNIAILFLYKRQQSRFSLTTDASSRLMGYTIGIFVSQLLLCIFWLLLTIQVFGSVFSADFNLRLANQYVWLNDLRTVAFPAWFLLWASSDLQERIGHKFGWMAKLGRNTASVGAFPSGGMTSGLPPIAISPHQNLPFSRTSGMRRMSQVNHGASSRRLPF